MNIYTYSESWTMCTPQERKLDVLHMHNLRHILNITWQDKVPNNTITERAGIPSMYTVLKQRHMCWLSRVVLMDDGQIPMDLLYGDLVQGENPTGRPQLCYKNVCKRYLKASSVDLNTWEAVDSDWLETNGADRPLQV